MPTNPCSIMINLFCTLSEASTCFLLWGNQNCMQNSKCDLTKVLLLLHHYFVTLILNVLIHEGKNTICLPATWSTSVDTFNIPWYIIAVKCLSINCILSPCISQTCQYINHSIRFQPTQGWDFSQNCHSSFPYHSLKLRSWDSSKV